jgi:hypothetical protein
MGIAEVSMTKTRDCLKALLCRTGPQLLIGCLLVVLIGGEPDDMLRLGMINLLPHSGNTPAPLPSEDDETETSKLAAPAHAARRSARRKVYPLGHLPRHAAFGKQPPAPGTESRWPLVRPAGEQAYRNGVGAPLRC